MVVDDREFIRFFDLVETELGQVGQAFAEELVQQVEVESASASSRVSKSWSIEGSGDELDVVSSIWWAHFLARGTYPHGPEEAPRLVFSLGGNLIFARHVAGIGPNPFHERAVEATYSRADEVMRQVLAGVT